MTFTLQQTDLQGTKKQLSGKSARLKDNKRLEKKVQKLYLKSGPEALLCGKFVINLI